jgi:CheY-like chemotaxis protein
MPKFKISEVFIIDDDAVVRMVASKILKLIGFQGKVSQLENGRDSLHEIQKRIENQTINLPAEPILILLDINMPVLDAWGFLDEFSLLEKSVKDHFLITIITSSIDSEDRLKAFSYSEVSDYITKPLSGKHVTDFLGKHNLYEED